MTNDVARAVTSLLSTCSRRLSRAARRLRRAHLQDLDPKKQLKKMMPASAKQLFSGRRLAMTFPSCGSDHRRDDKKVGGEDSELAEDDVWRRGIIMGEKCQPLDFSGVIYYDSDGKQMDVPPVARPPLQSPPPADKKGRK